MLTLFLSLFIAVENAHSAVNIENRQGVQVQTKLLHFTDEQGSPVVFDQYFNTEKPIILAFVFFECPGACTVLLNGMIDSLKDILIQPGQSFEIIVVSINPKEGASLALEKKETYLAEYGRPSTKAGWHFLTGTEENIVSLTQQVGFFYERDPNGLFVHPSGLFLLTPKGILSNTLIGIKFTKEEMRKAIGEAAGEKQGTFIDRVNVICDTYLPHIGWLDRPVRWLGLLSLMLLSGIAFFLRRVLFPILKSRP